MCVCMYVCMYMCVYVSKCTCVYVCVCMCVQVILERDALPNRPPLLVKIAPDLSHEEKEDIAAVITREKVRFAAHLCRSNTSQCNGNS